MTALAMKRAPLAPDDPRHGTLNGYNDLACRCCQCRGAKRAYDIEKRTRGIPPGHHSHGTYSGYKDFACRCEKCRLASKAYLASRAASGLPADDKRHGTTLGYNMKCRCDSCRIAKRNSDRASRLRRKGVFAKVAAVSSIELIVGSVKRGGKIEGELIDVRGLTREDLVLINECFADVRLEA